MGRGGRPDRGTRLVDPLEVRLDVPENYYDAVRRTEDATIVEITSINRQMELRDRRIVRASIGGRARSR